MTMVAVTGASGFLGQALLKRLDADRQVTRIIGVDVTEPEMPVGKLEFRTADLRDAVLSQALEGADVVVHTGAADPASVGVDMRYALTVRGTRNLLGAVGTVGVRKLVHVSSALVYGAHVDNDVPLNEDAALRADPDFSVAYHALLAEELVRQFDEAHPDVAVAIMRPVSVLGLGVDTFVTRHFEVPRLPLVRGCDPPVHFVDVDDLAAALHLAATGDLVGPYNVAAEGWLTAAEVSALLGKRALRLPEWPAFAIAARLRDAGLLTVEPGALRYLMYPWVVDTARLHAAGWSPTRGNREILRDFAAAHHGRVTVGPVRARRRDLALATALAVGLGTASVARALRRP